MVAAPTGSGKTGVFELAIARLLNAELRGGEGGWKIVYIAPVKALCSERVLDWRKKLSKVRKTPDNKFTKINI